MKRALVTGIAGQDGSYLAELLLKDGYAVYGLARPDSDMRHVDSRVHVLYGDLTDAESLKAAVAAAKPDEVYNLGGVTDLKTAYAEPDMTWQANYEAVGILLDAAVTTNPAVRFLQASSSEVFLPSDAPLNEESPRDEATSNPYAKAKLAADREVIAKARERGVFACSAILFNHESPRRSEKSALRKISRTLARVQLGLAPMLHVGNIRMQRDWGYAQDYARAMRDMLRRDVAEDLVIATGKGHQVQDAIDLAAKSLGMDLQWKGLGLEAKALSAAGKVVVDVSPELYKPDETQPKVGDARKARQVLGWQPTVDLAGLMELMVAHDLADLKTL